MEGVLLWSSDTRANEGVAIVDDAMATESDEVATWSVDVASGTTGKDTKEDSIPPRTVVVGANGIGVVTEDNIVRAEVEDASTWTVDATEGAIGVVKDESLMAAEMEDTLPWVNSTADEGVAAEDVIATEAADASTRDMDAPIGVATVEEGRTSEVKELPAPMVDSATDGVGVAMDITTEVEGISAWTVDTTAGEPRAVACAENAA